jgi:four helix bundle protein
LVIYRRTALYPGSERFGLTSQLRRSAASIGANIAESTGRSGAADQRRFLTIALGSARELEQHVLLARDLGYQAPADCNVDLRSVEQIEKMLRALVATRPQAS